MLLKRTQLKIKALNLANAAWIPSQQEEKALDFHGYVEGLGRVDQIWPWLKINHGKVLAVDAPHAFHPESFNYQELSERVSAAAAAFRTFGIKKNDVVTLFSENSPRWLVADQGIMRIDAINAVRGASAPIEELRYILRDSRAIAIVVQTADLWKKLDLSLDQKNRLKLVLQLEGEPAEGVVGWESFLSKGLETNYLDPNQDRGVDSASSSVATILYTSGTTGQPKGVPLSHANLLHQIKSLACVANPPAGSPVLSVLPIWHSYERSAEYYFFSCACTQTYTTIKKLKTDLPRVRPIVMATVPRLWEAIQSGFDDALKEMPPRKQQFLRLALSNSGAFKLALRTSRGLLINEVGYLRRFFAFLEVACRFPIHLVSDSLLWPKILKKLCGGNLQFPISGGGAIAPHVDSFFESLGVELLVGYGLTETSPVVSCRRPWRNIRGSSGLPLPQTEFRVIDPLTRAQKKINERGLVIVKGPQVMSGYLNKPDATLKVLDPEGWFDTGDLGMLLRDGTVVLTGRAKDTIVLSNGENIEPGPLEESLVASPLVEQVMLVGQDERNLGVLVVPKKEAILIWAKDKGLYLQEDLGGSPGDEDLRKLLRREINLLLAARAGSRPDERVYGVALVQPFTIENGLLTQTLKQRRDKIVARDIHSIASIFER
tara:strand:+ start:6611 stop:8587 length:1977 start_codon:yes stop_codon:yes gene_type:complete